MSTKLDSMNATGEASGNLLLSEMGYPHHIDFQKQHEHDQETMRILQDLLHLEKEKTDMLNQTIVELRIDISNLQRYNNV